jgi:integrase
MIEQVIRPKRWKNGKLVQSRLYRGRYRLRPTEKMREVALHTTDRQIAEQRLRQLILDEQREQAGMIPPKAQREAMQLDLAAHIKDYVADRRAVGRDEKYVRELERKLPKLAKECSWSRIAQVTAESFVRWRSKQKKHPKTLNEYLGAISGLMNWLGAAVPNNPLRAVQKVETRGAPTRKRHAYTSDEVRQLRAASGERGHLYTFAANTGLRRGELEKFECRDVHVDAARPYIDVRASISKNHKHEQLPLTADAVAALRRVMRPDAKPTDLIFKRLMPRMNRFRDDLAAAGIPYVNAKGEFADFHALRKTFGTWLMLAGVPEFVRMKLMRHSDIRLTQAIYTDGAMVPTWEAVGLLPSVGDTQIDTHVSVSEGLPVSVPVPIEQNQTVLLSAADQTFSPSESASVHETPALGGGARCRVRTCDLSPRRPLYPELIARGIRFHFCWNQRSLEDKPH